MSIVSIDLKRKKDTESAIEVLSKRLGTKDNCIVMISMTRNANDEATLNIIGATKLEALGMLALASDMVINSEDATDG